ncbi:hypothetical protein CEV31_2221 [Brucella thiophenivorans]|uniref:DUF3008 domain-containing protein n=2 Tax=Brucella thiophenivorans TaxID=571255 RepID=A0A256FWS2_9HYPH|nr:hypothetical protein CEV31_2221 [Brucella thiophenivorans]
MRVYASMQRWIDKELDVEMTVNPFIKGVTDMTAKSKAQQKAAGSALSAKRGEIKKSKLVGASKEMYESMTESELEEFAETKHKGLPEHVPDKKSS